MNFRCDECGKAFSSYFSMKRHRMTKHHVEAPGGDNESESIVSDMASNDSTTESELESSMEEGSSEDTGSTTKERTNVKSGVFDNMIARAYAMHSDEKDQEVSELIEEGVDKSDAAQQVHTGLLPKYRKSLRNIFRNILFDMQMLRKHPVYKAIMTKARELEDDGFDRDEAIRAALAHRKYLLYRMIPAEVDSDDDDL